MRRSISAWPGCGCGCFLVGLAVFAITLAVVGSASADDDSAAAVVAGSQAFPWGVLLAALSGVVAVALWALRSVPKVDAWLATKGLKWAKPAIGALLASAAAGLAAALLPGAESTTIANAALGGLVAGLAATGAHQVATKGNGPRPGK